MQLEEIWKDIPGYENYQASNLGRVKRLACLDKRGARLKEKVLVVSVQAYGAHGYLKSFVSIGLGRNRICECLSVGRAVLLAFRGLPLPKQVCRHLDDDIRNNNLTNLKWGTQKENVADAIKNGKRTTYGENVNSSKLKVENIFEIRDTFKNDCRDITVSRMAKKFGVTVSAIDSVLRKITWKHV